jgi:putative RNA 2'-phosphotransferase
MDKNTDTGAAPMDDRTLVKRSRFLSLVLRHKPEAVGLALGDGGWVDVAALLAALKAHGRGMTRAELDAVVAGNDKQRFAFSEDGRRIRANQGHSVEVDLHLEAAQPPEVLWHGTIGANLRAISRDGLLKGKRHAVHLSADRETASKVGARRGEPVLLAVRAGEMARDGAVFQRSDNGVWLVDGVPPRYIDWAATER